jgi:hypothetical protein
MTRRRGLPVLLAVAVALALVMTWPLVLHLGSRTARVEAWGDPLYLTWQVAWLGHALLHDPLHILHSNLYWPIKNNLTLTDVLFGYAPAGLAGEHGPQSALVVYNLLLILTFALAFLGAFLLARELGAGDLGASAAGAAFAYAPWKLDQLGHLQILSSGGIPLALYFLVRGYRRGRRSSILAGWLVAAWQMTLGFNLGLQLAYLLLVLGVVVVAGWIAHGRRRPDRAVLRATALGVAVFVLVSAIVALPYIRVQHKYPEAKMPAAEVAYFSPPLRGFLTAPKYSLVWGDATKGRRSTLRWPVEQTLFPGVTVLVLALVGLLSAAYTIWLRGGVAVGTLVCFALSLGLPSVDHPQRGLTVFRVLRDLAPGWNGVRTPGRINNLTSLGLALLAAAGLALLVRHVRRRLGSHAAATVAAVAVAAILVEGFGPMPEARPPARPAGALTAPAPQLQLPTIVGLDGTYAYWSVGGFPRLANAASSFDPHIVSQIRAVSKRFPDPRSVRFLRGIGIRSVVLHRNLARGTPWRNVDGRPTAGLGITRHDEGDLVVYDLGEVAS